MGNGEETEESVVAAVVAEEQLPRQGVRGDLRSRGRPVCSVRVVALRVELGRDRRGDAKLLLSADAPSGVAFSRPREGASRTLVPIRPRSRGARRSVRTSPGVPLRPSHGFNIRPRRLSTPSDDAFQLHPARRREDPRRGPRGGARQRTGPRPKRRSARAVRGRAAKGATGGARGKGGDE